MPIDLEKEKTPIDPAKGEYTQMLENLQGNILKGHGRDHTAHIFIKLKGEEFFFAPSLPFLQRLAVGD